MAKGKKGIKSSEKEKANRKKKRNGRKCERKKGRRRRGRKGKPDDGVRKVISDLESAVDLRSKVREA